MSTLTAFALGVVTTPVLAVAFIVGTSIARDYSEGTGWHFTHKAMTVYPENGKVGLVWHEHHVPGLLPASLAWQVFRVQRHRCLHGGTYFPEGAHKPAALSLEDLGLPEDHS